MIHLNRAQYKELRVFSHLVRQELMKKQLRKVISESTVLAGQNYGFCNDEIQEIVDECYNELVRLIHK